MNEFTIETTIERPASDVFAALQNLDSAPMWNTTLTEVRKTSDGPLGTGSQVLYAGRFLGRSYESPSEYTEFTENESFTSKTVSGPFELEVATRLEAVGEATKLTVHVQGDSDGFFKLAEPLVVRMTKRTFENAYENLKTLLEEGAL
jgi:uncharacterized protein YndB with AHSA1/START domain